MWLLPLGYSFLKFIVLRAWIFSERRKLRSNNKFLPSSTTRYDRGNLRNCRKRRGKRWCGIVSCGSTTKFFEQSAPNRTPLSGLYFYRLVSPSPGRAWSSKRKAYSTVSFQAVYDIVGFARENDHRKRDASELFLLSFFNKTIPLVSKPRFHWRAIKDSRLWKKLSLTDGTKLMRSNGSHFKERF